MREIKSIINVSLQGFCMELQEHVQEGWELDLNHMPNMFGIAYEAGLVRDDKTAAQLAQKLEDVIEGRPPKLTRSEIMAKARAARKCNQLPQEE